MRVERGREGERERGRGRGEGGERSENEKWVLLSTRFPADRHSRFFPVFQSRGEGYSEVRGER